MRLARKYYLKKTGRAPIAVKVPIRPVHKKAVEPVTDHWEVHKFALKAFIGSTVAITIATTIIMSIY